MPHAPVHLIGTKPTMRLVSAKPPCTSVNEVHRSSRTMAHTQPQKTPKYFFHGTSLLVMTLEVGQHGVKWTKTRGTTTNEFNLMGYIHEIGTNSQQSLSVVCPFPHS